MELVALLIYWFFAIAVAIFVIRYAIDSSKTSKKLDGLHSELEELRSELQAVRRMNNKTGCTNDGED